MGNQLIGEHHARENWFFSRGEQGEVHIRVDRGDAKATVTLTSTEWASVVAAVSAQGESGETYKQALEFHAQEQVGEDRG